MKRVSLAILSIVSVLAVSCVRAGAVPNDMSLLLYNNSTTQVHVDTIGFGAGGAGKGSVCGSGFDMDPRSTATGPAEYYVPQLGPCGPSPVPYGWYEFEITSKDYPTTKLTLIANAAGIAMSQYDATGVWQVNGNSSALTFYDVTTASTTQGTLYVKARTTLQDPPAAATTQLYTATSTPAPPLSR